MPFVFPSVLFSIDAGQALDVIFWLLEGDPAIRWQVMHDLADAPDDLVAAERARVAREGWGARMLALQQPHGHWPFAAPAFSSEAAQQWWQSLGPARQGTLMPAWTSITWSLALLRAFGLDPDGAAARRAVSLVRENVQWEHDAERVAAPAWATELAAAAAATRARCRRPRRTAGTRPSAGSRQ